MPINGKCKSERRELNLELLLRETCTCVANVSLLLECQVQVAAKNDNFSGGWVQKARQNI